MNEGTKQVDEGIKLADKAGLSLHEIVEVSQRVTDMVSQIAAASEEQSSASEQISKNVEGISSVTNQTAAGVQQIARAAEDLESFDGKSPTAPGQVQADGGIRRAKTATVHHAPKLNVKHKEEKSKLCREREWRVQCPTSKRVSFEGLSIVNSSERLSDRITSPESKLRTKKEDPIMAETVDIRGKSQNGSVGDELLQLVSFNIGEEEFGVDILKVQEINRMLEVTRVPNAPEYVDGVINLRGKVIPIIDLRRRFGLERKEHDKNTRIVVVELNGKVVGFVVDAVQEVLRIHKSVTEPPPPIVAGIEAEYITAVGKLEDRLLILLDLEKVLSNEHTKTLAA